MALLDDSDFTRLRSLAFSGVLDLPAVRGFLAAVFSPAAEGERTRRRGANGKAKAADAGEPAAVGAAAGGTSRGRKRKGEAAEPVGAGGGRSSRRKGTAEASEAGPTDSLSEAAHEEAGAGAGAASAGSDGEAGGAAEAAPQPQRRRFGVLAVKKLADELDMREEGMETVLSYLEAEEAPCLRMLPTAALSVRVSFYAAAPEALAQQHPVVQVGGVGVDGAQGHEGEGRKKDVGVLPCLACSQSCAVSALCQPSVLNPSSHFSRPTPTPPQHVLEACPHPRNGVYSAPAAKLAAAAQQAPGLVLQELRGLAAGGLIGFELSREEGPAYEVGMGMGMEAAGAGGGGQPGAVVGQAVVRKETVQVCRRGRQQHSSAVSLLPVAATGWHLPALTGVCCPCLPPPDPAQPARPGRPGAAGPLPAAGGAGLPGVPPGHVVPRAGGGGRGGHGGRPGRQRRRGGRRGAGGNAARGGAAIL